ncbi:unnamed protein product, partial [Cyprideis torosa]
QGEFDWDTSTQGLILGSFFWGYIFTQIPGGVLSKILGGKWVFGVGMLVTSVFTLLTPMAARMGVWALLCVRFVEGLGEGVAFPSMHCLMSHWVPPLHRSRYSAFIYLDRVTKDRVTKDRVTKDLVTKDLVTKDLVTKDLVTKDRVTKDLTTDFSWNAGCPFGTVLALSTSGLLASSSWRWPSVFYVWGVLGLLWVCAWLLLISETPNTHPRIKASERREIKEALGASVLLSTAQAQPIPYREIVKSWPFWAILVAHFGQNWGFYTLLTEIPTYLNNVLRVDLTHNGFLSSLPYLAMFLVGNVCSHIVDRFRERGFATGLVRKVANSAGEFRDTVERERGFATGLVRKVANSAAFLVPALALSCISYFGCNVVLVVAMLTATVGFMGMGHSGFNVNHLDIAPNFSGVLLGLTNCAATVPGILAPYVTGLIVHGDENSFVRWRTVFLIAAGILVLANLFYVMFASGVEQPWNRYTGTSDEIDDLGGGEFLGPSIRQLSASERLHVIRFVPCRCTIGAPVGTVISLAVSGVLASSSWGWPSVFYVFGLLGVLWFVGWAFFVYETPADHPRISDAEKREIRLSLGNSVHQESHKQDIPYKAICTSVPFWAIFVAHTCFTWGFYTLLTQIPTFMNAVLRVKLAENGLLSSLPYLAMFLVGNAGSQAIDHARSKGMRTVVARKLANSISFLIPAACLVGVSYMGCDVAGVVTVFTVCVGFFGLYHTGFNCNHLDIAPNFAGYLMGITNTAGTVSGILAPYVTGLIIDGKEHHVEQWRIVFYISAVVFFVGNTVFLLYASGEEQPWNRHGQDQEEDVEKPRKDGQKTNASMGVNGGVVNGTVNEGYQENYDGAGEANEAYIEESTKM